MLMKDYNPDSFRRSFKEPRRLHDTQTKVSKLVASLGSRVLVFLLQAFHALAGLIALGLVSARRSLGYFDRPGRISVLMVVAGVSAIVFAVWAMRGLPFGLNQPTAELSSELQRQLVTKEELSKHLGESVRKNQLPENIQLEIASIPVQAKVAYALDEELQRVSDRLLKNYRPDYGVIVAMDATTGRILAMSSHRSGRPSDENLALKASFPAASIFKVVTAGAVLDTQKVTPDTLVPFQGSNHTLYKRNVITQKENRWTRRMSVREAFGSSVNTIFGKLGLFYAGPEVLREYAERFHFNHPIRADVPVDVGYSRFSAEDPWSVVSAASGFTQDNTMSPLQGAMIAAAVINDGAMMEPWIIENVVDQQGNLLYSAEPRLAVHAIDATTAKAMRRLFRATVESGTSRQAFRKALRRRAFDEVEVGGKTGSLTGLHPRGKCDWFVGYMSNGTRKIAVAALTVNEEKWRVKSATLAESLFTHELTSGVVEQRRPGSTRASR
ncbi:MAG TPA: penicillin-binding transpeptidase domain-containing protein [Pseudobdellovibrionaceae bacterium]|nr:penicillin-binding transpeptidase domain-containing protein [Pseudobdellovibrionaceae bacterium]